MCTRLAAYIASHNKICLAVPMNPMWHSHTLSEMQCTVHFSSVHCTARRKLSLAGQDAAKGPVRCVILVRRLREQRLFMSLTHCGLGSEQSFFFPSSSSSSSSSSIERCRPCCMHNPFALVHCQTMIAHIIWVRNCKDTFCVVQLKKCLFLQFLTQTIIVLCTTVLLTVPICTKERHEAFCAASFKLLAENITGVITDGPPW